MELFELKNNDVVVHPAAYTLTPFIPIVKQRSKKKVMKELAYIYFMADYKSDFSDLLDEKERSEEVKEVLDLPDTWTPSEDVKNAMIFYKERQMTPSMHLLESTLKFVEKIKKFYDELDLNERDERGKPLHNVQQLQKGASEIGDLTDSLKKLREAVAKEIEEASRVRGGGEVGHFEDGIDI